MITNIKDNKIEICIDGEYYIYNQDFNNYYNNTSKKWYKGKISSDIYGLIWVDEKKLLEKLSSIVKNHYRIKKLNKILNKN